MTIESAHIILQMLQNKGVYPGDPPMQAIYSYTHANGQKLYACFLRIQHDDMRSSPFVTNPILLMKEGELTDEGKAEIATLQNQDSTMGIVVTCPKCKQSRTIQVPVKGHVEWVAGKHIQEAFPTLTPDDREGLISGTCHPCWEKLFAHTDEDEDPESASNPSELHGDA